MAARCLQDIPGAGVKGQGGGRPGSARHYSQGKKGPSAAERERRHQKVGRKPGKCVFQKVKGTENLKSGCQDNSMGGKWSLNKWC